MNAKRQWTQADHEAALRIDRVFIRRPWPGFDAAVKEYRQIEAELVEQAGDDEFIVLETKRRIAEWILECASRDNVLFERFQEAWNEMLALGFSGDDIRRHKTWVYAEYCLSNGHYDAGLAVFEPVLAEFVQWLQTTTRDPEMREFDFKELKYMQHLRDGLVACKSSNAEGIAWNERREAESDARDLNYTDREGRDRELDMELNRAMDTIAYASWPRSFSETTRDYRQLEAEFVMRLQGSDEFFIPETKRRILSTILMDAHKHKQPFDVCRDVWNELGYMEFRDILQKCAMAWFYADCCRFNKEPDAGLVVIEPLITELRKHADECTDSDELESYQAGIARLERLRDALNALQK